MASNRSNVGAIIGGTVAVAGVVGILGWWWWVYMEENKDGYKKPQPDTPPPSQLAATAVEDEDTADLAAAEQPGPDFTDPGGPQVPTMTLSGS